MNSNRVLQIFLYFVQIPALPSSQKVTIRMIFPTVNLLEVESPRVGVFFGLPGFFTMYQLSLNVLLMDKPIYGGVNRADQVVTKNTFGNPPLQRGRLTFHPDPNHNIQL